MQLWDFPLLEFLELEGGAGVGGAFCISSSLPCNLLALHLRCTRLDFEVALEHCRRAVSWLVQSSRHEQTLLHVLTMVP